MAVFNEPSKWQTSLVNSGDANNIPQSTPAGTGEASFEDGFPQITQVPIGAGGIAPDRKDFNGLFKILGDWIFFAQNGGLPTYSSDFDYVEGRYVVYNNTLYKCIQANGASSTVVAPDSVSPLGSDYWKDIENQDSTSLIPNQTIVSELPLTDANLHLKDGALLSGSGTYSDYVDLIAEIYNGGNASSSFCTEAEWQTSNTNYGFCNKFVYDSVANTVRLPKVNSEHGALIKSYSSGSDWYRIYEDGFCEQGGYNTNPAQSTVTLLKNYTNSNYTVVLTGDYVVSPSVQVTKVNSKNASSFTIYNGNAAYACYWTACGYVDISDLQTAPIYEYIVVGTVSKTQIQIDIDNVMADLALKADKDFSNVTAPTQAFKNSSIEWGQPDYTSAIEITLTLGSAVSYIAPDDGFIIYTLTSIPYQNASIVVNNHNVVDFRTASSSEAVTSSGIVPVHKGDSISITATGASSGYLVRHHDYAEFVPCKGV